MSPSEVLKKLKVLREDYRKQLFVYTPEQKKEYDRLIAIRRDRVKSFYADGKVSKGGSSKPNVEVT